MKSRESELIMLYLISDLIILNLSVILIASVFPVVNLHDYYNFSTYLLHANLSWIITYFVFSKKNLFLRDGYINRVKRITNRIFVFIIVALVLAYLFMPRTTYSRIFLLEYTLLFYIGKLIYYYLLYRYLKAMREKGIHVNRVIIVGLNDTARQLNKLIRYNPTLGYKFIGYVSDELNSKDLLGSTNELEQVIKEHHIEMVFVTLSIYNESKKSKDFLRLCNKTGVRLRFVPENQQWFKNRINMESVGQLVLINPQEIPLDVFESQFFKRMFDIVFSLFIIVFILSWLIPILAILIKLNSKGPVFFVQKRTGINNKTFKCLKFRSMKVNKESDEKQATAGDKRITALGNFMRKSNFDELPQFFNVLIGQMSVVGPRPHMLKHTEQYSELIERYLVRHYIKPGITGFAQVSGYRGETDELWKMQKRVQYDMNYLENWNFWWDMKIIIMTFISPKRRSKITRIFMKAK
ncbi:MAG: undecaprenyl-phosphate glucose phosphotransferase [Paludibacter sp.]|nr:undecaprenyl-phosphate glucose phosphotransferase [Paludibacter sp.]